MWTNTSLPPFSGWIKPKPLVELNHLTVPVVMKSILWQSLKNTRAARMRGRIKSRSGTKARPAQGLNTLGDGWLPIRGDIRWALFRGSLALRQCQSAFRAFQGALGHPAGRDLHAQEFHPAAGEADVAERQGRIALQLGDVAVG